MPWRWYPKFNKVVRADGTVATVPILFIVMRIANDKKILEDKINTRFSNIIGWFTFAFMTISVIVMFLSFYIWS